MAEYGGNKIIEEKKYLTLSLTTEWFERLLELVKNDRQSSAAAEVRLMIMIREDELKEVEKKKQ